jgi:hypothetical protein
MHATTTYVLLCFVSSWVYVVMVLCIHDSTFGDVRADMFFFCGSLLYGGY